MEKLRDKIRQQENEPTYGLRKRSQMPFFRIFKRELIGDDVQPSEQQISNLVSLTQEISEKIKCEISMQGFWESVPSQNNLTAKLKQILILRIDKFPTIRQKYSEILTYLMETARAIQSKILTDNE